MTTRVKICGLRTPETVAAAIAAGADMIGFVFHPRSPRFVTVEQAAALATRARGRVEIVALVDDADDTTIRAISDRLQPDLLQLHGRESVERVSAIRAAIGRPVMKAIAVAAAADAERAFSYVGVADRILFDAKAPKGAAYSGGHGLTFDWRALEPVLGRIDFTLSGGLHAGNVAEAIRLTRPAAVDVSSGVESAPGVKDIDAIAAFVRAAKAALSST